MSVGSICPISGHSALTIESSASYADHVKMVWQTFLSEPVRELPARGTGILPVRATLGFREQQFPIFWRTQHGLEARATRRKMNSRTSSFLSALNFSVFLVCAPR